MFFVLGFDLEWVKAASHALCTGRSLSFIMGGFPVVSRVGGASHREDTIAVGFTQRTLQLSEWVDV